MTEGPGYTSEEIERGEDRAWHIPFEGCLAAAMIAAVLAVEYLSFVSFVLEDG